MNKKVTACQNRLKNTYELIQRGSKETKSKSFDSKFVTKNINIKIEARTFDFEFNIINYSDWIISYSWPKTILPCMRIQHRIGEFKLMEPLNVINFM